MKKIFALISLVVVTMTAAAQLSVVEDSFKLRPNDITARRERRIDDNNTECSLLKIKTLNITEEERKQFEFRGDALTQFVDRRFPTGEIWVWLTPEASFIEFRHPKYSTCKYIFPEKMEPLKVYDLTLKAEWNDGPGQKKPTLNYLVVKAEPTEAMVYVNDGQHEYTGIGEVSRAFPMGTTVSWRIECNMYYPESGKVTINSGEPVSVEKKLVPAFGYLSIDSKPESGAKVSIDGNLVGETPYRSGRLASGTHKVTLLKDMYKTTEQTVTVTDGNTATVTVNMPANFADITLTTDAESEIYIDNQYKGKGRWSGRLIAGTYLAEARKASHSTKFKTLNIVEGKNETIKIDDPTPIYGMLDVNTSPTGATIYIDGKNCSTTPRILSEVLIGKHTLSLEKAGCAPVTKEINIEKDEMLSVNEKLPEGKSITITSEPSGASVYVDGNYFGTTPLTKELAFGSHTVKASLDGEEKTQTINVSQNGSNTLDFNLSKNPTFTVNSVTFEMVAVQGGTFTMGATSEQGSDYDNDEKPTHSVTLSDYMIGKYEVTVEQFSKFIDATGYVTDAEKEGWGWIWTGRSGKWQWEKENGVNWMCGVNGKARNMSEYNHPVIFVSWNDAVEFCSWLSRETGQNFRLPTEAEWEYAARGGNKSRGYKYSGSNDLGYVGWYGNSGSDSNANGTTHPVGTKSPNELGIYDMSGNVWEWCEDWYGDYSSGSQTNPKGPSSGSDRVLRGGSWSYYAQYCRVAFRYNYSPGNRYDGGGFRVALVP